MAVYKTRRPTRTVHVRWGQNDVTIGGMSPVRVQSMTNTATADVEASVNQVLVALAIQWWVTFTITATNF